MLRCYHAQGVSGEIREEIHAQSDWQTDCMRVPLAHLFKCSRKNSIVPHQPLFNIFRKLGRVLRDHEIYLPSTPRINDVLSGYYELYAICRQSSPFGAPYRLPPRPTTSSPLLRTPPGPTSGPTSNARNFYWIRPTGSYSRPRIKNFPSNYYVGY